MLEITGQKANFLHIYYLTQLDKQKYKNSSYTVWFFWENYSYSFMKTWRQMLKWKNMPRSTDIILI
jgi:hypothetical protein